MASTKTFPITASTAASGASAASLALPGNRGSGRFTSEPGTMRTSKQVPTPALGLAHCSNCRGATSRSRSQTSPASRAPCNENPAAGLLRRRNGSRTLEGASGEVHIIQGSTLATLTTVLRSITTPFKPWVSVKRTADLPAGLAFAAPASAPIFLL
jgi:hypothetical protein